MAYILSAGSVQMPATMDQEQIEYIMIFRGRKLPG